MRVIERDIVGAGIISSDGKALLVKSNPANKGSYEGLWVVPGGGIEEGETAEDAVRREALEETGIDLLGYICELVASGRKGQTEKTLKNTGERVLVNMEFHEFKIVIHDKQANQIPVMLSHEHSEYRWCTPEDVRELKLSPPSHAFFELLGFIK